MLEVDTEQLEAQLLRNGAAGDSSDVSVACETNAPVRPSAKLWADAKMLH